jgi:hypothetical protein
MKEKAMNKELFEELLSEVNDIITKTHALSKGLNQTRINIIKDRKKSLLCDGGQGHVQELQELDRMLWINGDGANVKPMKLRVKLKCSGCGREIDTDGRHFINDAGAWCDDCFETENPRTSVN